MTPSPPPPHPPPPPTHTPQTPPPYILYKPHLFPCMHVNMRSLLSLGHRTCLSLTMCWSHASGQEFRMVPGLYTMYEVFKGERNISCKYILG